MKKDIHPKYVDATITCACGEVIQTRSTKKEIRVGVCSKCHPFFTGTQKYVDTAGRVEKFIKKYAGAKNVKKKIRTRAGETTVSVVEAGAGPVAAEGVAETPIREASPAPEGAPPASAQPPAGPVEEGAPQPPDAGEGGAVPAAAEGVAETPIREASSAPEGAPPTSAQPPAGPVEEGAPQPPDAAHTGE